MKLSKTRIFIIAALVLVILGIIFSLLTSITPRPKIVSIKPDTKAPLSLTSNITVTVDKPLETSKDLSFSLSGNTPIRITKKENIYTVTPEIVLSPETDYLLTIFFDGKILEQTTYTTPKATELPITDQQALQNQADLYYSGQLNKILTEKPWINNLPIISNKYTVIYNPTTGGVDVYQKTLLTDSEKQALLKQLQTKGVPATNLLYVTPTPTK